MNPIEVPIAHEERHAGALEVLALQPDPPEFRSDHRLLGGAAAALLHGRHGGLGPVRAAVRRTVRAPPDRRVRRRKGLFTLFGIVFFFIGLALFGIGLLGEYVGRIYAQVRERPRYIVEAVLEEGDAERGTGAARRTPRASRTAAVAAATAARSLAVTRAVVFAYSEVGVRCVRELLAQGVDIPLLFTHADDPGESQWFGSVRELARSARPARRDAGGSRTRSSGSPRGARARPDFLFSFYYRHMLERGVARDAARGRAQHARLAAAQISRPRARALGDHPRRDRSPARACTTWWRSPMPARSSISRRCRSWRTTRRSRCRSRWRRRRDRCCARSLPKLIAGTAAARAAGSRARAPISAAAAPRTDASTGAQGARAVHDLVRAVAPPFPGAFTEVNGCRLAVLETRIDAEPARHAGAGAVSVCRGRRVVRRLRRRQAPRDPATGDRRQRPVAPRAAPPALANQPLALDRSTCTR